MKKNESLMNLDDALTACEEHINSIIPEIIEILVEDQIEYEQVNDYELIIKGKNKKNTKKIINKLNIDPSIVKILISLTENLNDTTIRQNYM